MLARCGSNGCFALAARCDRLPGLHQAIAQLAERHAHGHGPEDDAAASTSAQQQQQAEAGQAPHAPAQQADSHREAADRYLSRVQQAAGAQDVPAVLEALQQVPPAVPDGRAAQQLRQQAAARAVHQLALASKPSHAQAFLELCLERSLIAGYQAASVLEAVLAAIAADRGPHAAVSVGLRLLVPQRPHSPPAAPALVALLLRLCGDAADPELLLACWRQLAPLLPAEAPGGAAPHAEAAPALMYHSLRCDLVACGVQLPAQLSGGGAAAPTASSSAGGEGGSEGASAWAWEARRRLEPLGGVSGVLLEPHSHVAEALRDVLGRSSTLGQDQEGSGGGAAGGGGGSASGGLQGMPPWLLSPEQAAALLDLACSEADATALLGSRLLQPDGALPLLPPGGDDAGAGGSAPWPRGRAGAGKQRHGQHAGVDGSAGDSSAGSAAGGPPPRRAWLRLRGLPAPVAAAAVDAYVRAGAWDMAAAVASAPRAAAAAPCGDAAWQTYVRALARAGNVLGMAAAVQSRPQRAALAPDTLADCLRAMAVVSAPPAGARGSPERLLAFWDLHGSCHPAAWAGLAQALWLAGDRGQLLRPILRQALLRPWPLQAGTRERGGGPPGGLSRGVILHAAVEAMVADPGELPHAQGPLRLAQRPHTVARLREVAALFSWLAQQPGVRVRSDRPLAAAVAALGRAHDTEDARTSGLLVGLMAAALQLGMQPGVRVEQALVAAAQQLEAQHGMQPLGWVPGPAVALPGHGTVDIGAALVAARTAQAGLPKAAPPAEAGQAQMMQQQQVSPADAERQARELAAGMLRAWVCRGALADVGLMMQGPAAGAPLVGRVLSDGRC